MNKKIYILAGGTIFHLRPHLAICCPVYGTTGKELTDLCIDKARNMDVYPLYTKMALNSCKSQKELDFSLANSIESNEDVKRFIQETIIPDPSVKIVFLPVGMCDYTGSIKDIAGKDLPRLSTKINKDVDIKLTPAEKVINIIRKVRKDIFVVGFKATYGKTEDEQYLEGLNLLKEASLNLVLANDIHTKTCMIITPEEARYHTTKDRREVLENLVDMTLLRSHLTFTRSTIVNGTAIPWNSELIPSSLRKVINYCIEKGAYKPFRGATVGHFAVKLDDNTFLTSIRKSNFNDIEKNGLVKIKTDGPDNVFAYGHKPSVGGQSQRIIFADHKDKEYNCIVHFHCPIKEGSLVPIVSQREYECGSHECGKNTSNGLKQFGNLSAVYLDNHGPNIVFNKNINPEEVQKFIDDNFDLSSKTGGYVDLGKILKI